MTLILSTLEAAQPLASTPVDDRSVLAVETVTEARMPTLEPDRTARARLRLGLLSAGAAVIPAVYVALPLTLVLREYRIPPAAALCAVLVLLALAALLIVKTVARTMRHTSAELARTSPLGVTSHRTSRRPGTVPIGA